MLFMFLANVLDMAQPVIAQTNPIPPQRSSHAAAAIVSAHDDVAHFQDIHCKLHDRQTVQIGVHHQIGDVAMDEQLSGKKPDNLIGGHPAVGATNPQIARRLLL